MGKRRIKAMKNRRNKYKKKVRSKEEQPVVPETREHKLNEKATRIDNEIVEI